MKRHSSPPKRRSRLAAAAVELAVVTPVFTTLVFLGIESGHALNMSQKLHGAVRDGGRLAAKDVDKSLLNGQTANEKVIGDIKNLLKAEGFPAASITLTITHADGANAGQPFDLSDTNNQYKLMKVSATVPYNSVSLFPTPLGPTQTLSANLIQMRGRSTLSN